MIRPLQPLDIALYALFGGRDNGNRAYTLGRLGGEAHPHLSKAGAVRASVSLRRKRVSAWAWTRGYRVMGIAAARPRSGPLTWELSQLYLPSDRGASWVELLDRLCRGVARGGGERVFLRLRGEDPLVKAAGGCGFVLCAHESLFKGRPAPTWSTRRISLRARAPADDFSLFRLFNGATPQKARLAAGVTFEQWRSAQEPSGRRSREYVYERQGEVRGWIRAMQRGGATQLTMMVYPEDEANLSALIDGVLVTESGPATVYCLVQDHHVLLQRLLSQRGYQEVCEYATLVKSIGAPVIQGKALRLAATTPTQYASYTVAKSDRAKMSSHYSRR